MDEYSDGDIEYMLVNLISRLDPDLEQIIFRNGGINNTDPLLQVPSLIQVVRNTLTL